MIFVVPLSLTRMQRKIGIKCFMLGIALFSLFQVNYAQPVTLSREFGANLGFSSFLGDLGGSDDIGRPFFWDVDPAVTSSDESVETGIVVCGVDYGNHVYVLEDCSVSAATPEQWASVVVDAYKRWNADSVVAEVNQGGDMVESIILQKSRSLRVIKVRATKGKAVSG